MLVLDEIIFLTIEDNISRNRYKIDRCKIEIQHKILELKKKSISELIEIKMESLESAIFMISTDYDYFCNQLENLHKKHFLPYGVTIYEKRKRNEKKFQDLKYYQNIDANLKEIANYAESMCLDDYDATCETIGETMGETIGETTC